MIYLAVAVGGAAGAVSRFWVYNAFVRWVGGKFPYATLTINVLGSLLIGIAFVVITERVQFGPHWRGVITVGFLGAFTTFSTFSMDILGLMEQGHYWQALAYVLSSVGFCLMAAWLGLTIGREFF